MKPSNDLFLLIKSLNKGEKRYFRLYVKKYEKDSNYLRLFDAVEKQEEYNEQAIKKVFRGEKFAQRLSVTKDYLYEMILRSLRDYDGEDSPEMELLALRRDIKNLLRKRLYRQAEKLIAKAKAISYKYDLFGEQLSIMGDTAYLPWSDRAEIFKEWREISDNIENSYEFGYFAEQMRIMAETKRIMRTPSDLAELESLERQYGKDPAEARSFSAKLRHHFGYGKYHQLRNNKEAELAHNKAIVDLYHEYPQFIQTQTLGYLSEVRLYCSLLLSQGKYAEAREILDTLERIEVPAQIFPFKAMLILFMEQNYYHSRHEFEKLIELEARYAEVRTFCRDEMSSYGVSMDVHFLSNFAYGHFVLGGYHTALKYINALLELPEISQYSYMENSARIMQLILHYELGNMDLLEYRIRSSYRFFMKRDRLYAFERAFLHHLRGLTSVGEKQALRQWMQSLHDEVKKLSSDTREREFLMMYNYPAWIESKLDGEELISIIRRTRRQQQAA